MNIDNKQSSKTNHEHSYVPCLLDIDTGNPIRKRIPFIEIAEYCTVCGRIGKWNCFIDAKKLDVFKKTNPDAPTFKIKYKDRYVKKF